MTSVPAAQLARGIAALTPASHLRIVGIRFLFMESIDFDEHLGLDSGPWDQEAWNFDVPVPHCTDRFV